MGSKEDRDILRKGGFAEKEALQLHKLRTDYHEKTKRQTVIDHRRLEFVRWLVNTGKLSDQIA